MLRKRCGEGGLWRKDVTTLPLWGRTDLYQWGHFGLRGRLQTSGSPGGGAELSGSEAVFSSWGECRVSTWVSLQNYCTSTHLRASESLSPPVGPLPTPRPSPLLCSYHFVPGWFRH